MVAHIFLHEVLDAWYAREVRPRMRGRTFLIRLADACGIGGEREDDARRIMTVLPKRVARFGRTMHPTKTALVAFRKPDTDAASDAGNGTCEFLGFTHDGTQARRGSWVIKRRTARKRLRRTMNALWQWCRHQRHTALREQDRMRCQKLCGHFQYDGLRGNYPRLAALFRFAEQAWGYGLNRRGQRPRIGVQLDWLRARYPLPIPTIVHAI